MEPIHPNTDEYACVVALQWVLLFLIVTFAISVMLGFWDKFLAVIQEWDLHGVMGLWGE